MQKTISPSPNPVTPITKELHVRRSPTTISLRSCKKHMHTMLVGLYWRHHIVISWMCPLMTNLIINGAHANKHNMFSDTVQWCHSYPWGFFSDWIGHDAPSWVIIKGRVFHWPIIIQSTGCGRIEGAGVRHPSKKAYFNFPSCTYSALRHVIHTMKRRYLAWSLRLLAGLSQLSEYNLRYLWFISVIWI